MNGSTKSNRNKKEDRPKKTKKAHPRFPFSKEEDNVLTKLVKKYGTVNWAFISKQIKGRNARQCRDRWSNYLSPEVANRPWTPEEEEFLVKKYEEFGPCWKQIATFFPTRTDINIKSRWNLRERRIKKEKLKQAKDLFYQRIFNLQTQVSPNNLIQQPELKSEDQSHDSPQIQTPDAAIKSESSLSKEKESLATNTNLNQDEEKKTEEKDDTQKKCHFTEELLSNFENDFDDDISSEEYF